MQGPLGRSLDQAPASLALRAWARAGAGRGRGGRGCRRRAGAGQRGRRELARRSWSHTVKGFDPTTNAFYNYLLLDIGFNDYKGKEIMNIIHPDMSMPKDVEYIL